MTPADPAPAPDLVGLLADRSGTVVLTQASTPTEARLIRERIAAAGGVGRPLVSVGPSGEGLPSSLVDGDEDVRLVPVRVAWLPEEHAGLRAARLADLRPGHDPYHPSERQQQRILARQPGRAVARVPDDDEVGIIGDHSHRVGEAFALRRRAGRRIRAGDGVAAQPQHGALE